MQKGIAWIGKVTGPEQTVYGYARLYSNKDISILEWLSQLKNIQSSRGEHDSHAIYRLCTTLSEMNCSDTKVNEIGKDFCIAFVEYLKTRHKTQPKEKTLKPKTVFNYQCTFETSLNVAVRGGIIPPPIPWLSHHERAKASKWKRDYLTIDEEKRLIATIRSRTLISLPLTAIMSVNWNGVT